MPKKPDRIIRPLRVAIYTRFSSKLQNDTSTEGQIRECREVAREKGWIVLDKYIRSDEAKTGRTLRGRDALDELLQLAQQPDCPFDGILLYETSRLARKLEDSLKIAAIMKHHDKFLYFKTRSLDSRDPHFRQLFIDHAEKDEQSSEDTGFRVHRAHRGRVLEGLVPSGRKFGYKNIEIPAADGKKWRNGRKATGGVRREIIPEQRDLIVRMAQMYASGLGYQAIAQSLNKEQIPSPGALLGWPGKSWNANTVSSILKDTTYIGRPVWNKRKQVYDPIDGHRTYKPHPEEEFECAEMPELRIISDDLWRAVERERERKKVYATAREDGGLNKTEASRKYLFSGLLRCELCGSLFIAFRGVRGNVRYECGGSRSGKCMVGHSITQTLLEAQLLPAISKSIGDSSARNLLATEYRKDLVAQWNEQRAVFEQVSKAAHELRQKRESLRREADNIIDALQAARGNPLLIERLDRIQEEFLQFDADLAMAETDVPSIPSEEETKNLVIRKLAELDTALNGEPELVKRTLLRHIDKLIMRLVETPGGPRYEVSGEIRVFEESDPEDVLLTASSQRTCKQYTPISFPLNATLIVRAHEWEKRSQSSETRKKIGDANRKRWAARKKAATANG